MSKENQILFPFTPLKGRKISAVFDEPLVSSDGGLLLIREALIETGIIRSLVEALHDPRHPSYVDHTLEEMLTQRVAQICCGYEDADDCDALRDDPLFKLAAGRLPEEEALASQPTMSRLENRVSANELLRLGYALVDQFRLFLHSAAYVVMHYLRSVKLRGTQLSHAQFDTIRLRLLKIGTRVESGKTRLLVHLPEAFAELGTFTKAARVGTG